MDGWFQAWRTSRLVALMLSSLLVAVSCADSKRPAPAPTPLRQRTPLAIPTQLPTLQPNRTPERSATPTQAEAPGSSSVHRSVVVTIPDVAMATLAPGTTSPRVIADPGASAVPFVPAESIDTVDKRLNVTIGGQTHYIRNGGRIEMGDGLAVEVYIDPYPPTTLHSILDVYVTRDGEPVPDISVDVEFDMLSMLHGPFAATARDIGGGHHLATLDYIMFGAWDQFVTIRLGLDRIRFPVVIVAYP